MEDVSVYQKKANDEIKSAEVLLTKTYPMTEDEKLFLSILSKLYYSLEFAMNAYLADETTSKDSFNAKVKLISEKTIDLSETDFEFIQLIRKLYLEHEDSNVEFARKEKFIIADDDFTLHTLSVNGLNEYLERAKKIVAELLMNSKN